MEGRKTSRSEPARESGAGSAVYELFIFALTIFSLLVLVAYWLPPVSAVTRQALFRIDILLSLIFLADSFRSLFHAPDKWAYLKWGWLDFLGSVPAVLPLRFARLARLLRAWRVVRTRRPRQVLREFERDRAQGVLLVTIFMAVMVLTMASILVLEPFLQLQVTPILPAFRRHLSGERPILGAVPLPFLTIMSLLVACSSPPSSCYESAFGIQYG